MIDLEIARVRVDDSYRTRRLAIVAAHRMGMPIRQIGGVLRLSPARVHQILAESTAVPETGQASSPATDEPTSIRVQETEQASGPIDPLPPWRNQPFTPTRERAIARAEGVEIVARADADADLVRVLAALRAAVARLEGETGVAP